MEVAQSSVSMWRDMLSEASLEKLLLEGLQEVKAELRERFYSARPATAAGGAGATARGVATARATVGAPTPSNDLRMLRLTEGLTLRQLAQFFPNKERDNFKSALPKVLCAAGVQPQWCDLTPWWP